MLKPVPMAKVAIVGPKAQLEQTVETVHELALLHIEDYQPGDEGFELGRPLPQGVEVSQRLLKLRGLLKGAQFQPPAAATKFTPENLRSLQERLAEVEEELSNLVDRRTAALDQLKKLEEEDAFLRRVQHFPLPLQLLHGYRSVATAVGFVPSDADPSPLQAIAPEGEVETSAEAEGTFAFIAVPRKHEKALQETLAKLKFQPVEVPATVQGTSAARMAILASDRTELQANVQDLEAKLAAIRERHGAAFYALDEYLNLLADRSSAPVRFRTTHNAFMIEGWVPRAELSRLRIALTTATHNLVFVTELPTEATQPWKVHKAGAGHHDEAHEGHEAAHATAVETPPVALAQKGTAGNYILLTDTYSRPKYSEFDPTLFFFVGFPLFYGLMLGDIGYGALLLLLVWTGVFNKVFDFFGFQSKRQLNKIFTHCAVSSIAFGLLFSEFFGLELFGHEGVISHYETHFGPIPYPLSRFANVKLLLLLSLGIAAIHMLIGLSLGLRNAADAHGWSQAIKHRGSWFLVMLGAAIAGAAGLPKLLGLEHLEVANPTPLFYGALALFLVGVVLLLLGEGGIALLELPTVLSNLLSYTRLVAIGLSGAGIALAGNKVAKLVMANGVVGLIAGILILVFFHGLNLALGVIGPALHSLRLHYVEFFTKFYEGGGDPYTPFAPTRKYTQKEVKQA